MPAQFQMSKETLLAYRALRYDEDAKSKCIWLPVGFVIWDDEYPGDYALPKGDDDAYNTMARLHAARWHY